MESRPQPRAERRRLSHVDRSGRPRMVDVSAKPITARRAVAEASVVSLARDDESRHRWRRVERRRPERRRARRSDGRETDERADPALPPAARSPTSSWSITPDRAAGALRIRAEAATTGQTGVEMEAMTAASVAALTVYDMVKGVERGVEIRAVRLVSKTGGKSGTWVRPAGPRTKAASESHAPRPGPASPVVSVAPKRKGRRMTERLSRIRPRHHRQRWRGGRRSRGHLGRRSSAPGSRISASPSTARWSPTIAAPIEAALRGGAEGSTTSS